MRHRKPSGGRRWRPQNPKPKKLQKLLDRRRKRKEVNETIQKEMATLVDGHGS